MVKQITENKEFEFLKSIGKTLNVEDKAFSQTKKKNPNSIKLFNKLVDKSFIEAAFGFLDIQGRDYQAKINALLLKTSHISNHYEGVIPYPFIKYAVLHGCKAKNCLNKHQLVFGDKLFLCPDCFKKLRVEIPEIEVNYTAFKQQLNSIEATIEAILIFFFFEDINVKFNVSKWNFGKLLQEKGINSQYNCLEKINTVKLALDESNYDLFNLDLTYSESFHIRGKSFRFLRYLLEQQDLSLEYLMHTAKQCVKNTLNESINVFGDTFKVTSNELIHNFKESLSGSNTFI